MDNRGPSGFPGAASVAKLTSWMMLAVKILESFAGNVRIDLGR
jgi:hypothetical protein